MPPTQRPERKIFPVLRQFKLCRRSYTEVLKDFFKEKLLPGQKLFSTEERYKKILEIIPDECMKYEFYESFFFLFKKYT